MNELMSCSREQASSCKSELSPFLVSPFPVALPWGDTAHRPLPDALAMPLGFSASRACYLCMTVLQQQETNYDKR